MTKDKKFMISIFDGTYTRVYTTEAKDLWEAEKKVIKIHTFQGFSIIKLTSKQI